MTSMEDHLVHRLMFYKLEPKAITYLSYDSVNNLLAVLRSDNRVEIWDMKAVPYIRDTILLKPQTKLKGFVWCGSKLFGADLEGFVKEFNLLDLMEVNSYPLVSGGPCHCVAVNKSNTLLAAGSELGFINVFAIEEDSLSLVKLMQTNNKRILSLCWDASGKYLVTSGAESIKMYNYKDEDLLHIMKPTKLSKNMKLIIWSVVITNDFTIIAGDSSGTLSIWDGKNGICIDSIKSHSSDILTVCLSNNQESIFCTGIDPDIKIFDKIKMKDNSIKWVKSRDIINHTHDVNGVVQLNDGRLCSGGVDSYLMVAKIAPYVVHLYPPLLQSPSVYISVASRYILLRYSLYLELWHLKNIKPDIICSDPFIKLVELRSVNNELIHCADISNDGKFIAYATNTTARVFGILFDDEKPVLQPLSMNNCILKRFHKMSFSGSSDYFVVSDQKSLIQVFSTSTENKSDMPLCYNIDLTVESKWAGNTIHLFATSNYKDYIAISGSKGLIGVWMQGKFLTFLPKYSLPATAITFHPEENILYAVYSDFTFIEFSLDVLHYTPFSRSFDSSLLEKYLSRRQLPVTNISFDYDNSNIIILSTSSNICTFDKNKILNVEHTKKKMKLDPNINKSPFKRKNKQKGFNNLSRSKIINLKSYFEKDVLWVSDNDLAEDSGFHVYEKYQHLVHFGNISSKEMVAVEIKPKQFLEKLPPFLKKKQYGRK